MAITYPYWNNDEVISSDKLNSMVQAIINGDPLAVKVSNATKNDVNQIVSYLSSLHDKAKTNLNSATSTNDLDSAYTNMTALVSNKLGAYANDDTVDLYSTGIRASIITFLQAYDTMMSNDRLNNKNTDNTLGSRIDSEKGARETADEALDTKISDMQANGGGRNLLLGTVPKSSSNLNGWSMDSGWAGTHAFVDGGTTNLFALTNSTTNASFLWSPFVLLKKGEVYTLSYYAFASTNTANSGGVYVINEDSSETQAIADAKHLDPGKAIRYVYTFTFNHPSGKYRFRFDNNGTTDGHEASVFIGKLMFEKGTVAHDWSLAPEDNSDAIKAVDAKADANTASIFKITSNGGGRNLLHGTSGDWIAKTGTGWLNFTTATSNKTSVADYNTGDEFTYSLTVTNDSDSDVLLEMYRCDKDGNRITSPNGRSAINSDHVAPNTHHKRISCTISIDENTWFIEHILIAAGGTGTSKTVKIKGEMFEVGTVAHDWSPNPDEVQSQIDNLNANKLSSADANWGLVAKNSSNTYNYASGSTINLPHNSNITIKDDRVISRIHLPSYFTDYFPNAVSFHNLATMGECDNVFIPSATMATLDSRPTNPDTGVSLTGDCFFTNHYAYSGATVRAFQKIYSCDYNYVFIRSYNGSSQSWTNWSCLTPYA